MKIADYGKDVIASGSVLAELIEKSNLLLLINKHLQLVPTKLSLQRAFYTEINISIERYAFSTISS